MRLLPLSIPLLFLAACGGPETSQANNSQANISNSASPPATSNAMIMLAAAPSKAQALRIMHERHEGMEHMGKAAKAIGRELNSSNPNLETIRNSAVAITNFAPHVAALFPKGTGPDVGNTGAKPEIWQNPQDFTAKAGDLQKAARTFGAAVGAKDLNAIKSAFATLGNSCKACHDKYRSEMKH